MHALASDPDRLVQLEEDTKERLRRLKEEELLRSIGKFEPAELSASSQSAIARQQELKEVVEKRKRARELAVPTNDNAVKLRLREFEEPIVLFGEAAPERRERLRDIMAQNLNLDEPYEAPRGGESPLDKLPKRSTIAAPDDAVHEEHRSEQERGGQV